MRRLVIASRNSSPDPSRWQKATVSLRPFCSQTLWARPHGRRRWVTSAGTICSPLITRRCDVNSCVTGAAKLDRLETDSRHFRRSGSCRTLRVRDFRGCSPARHSGSLWPAYRRDRNGRRRCTRHRRAHCRARLRARRSRRDTGVKDRQGSGRRVGSALQGAGKTLAQGTPRADGTLRRFALTQFCQVCCWARS